MDRLGKLNDSSLELLRCMLKGVLALEQSKSKQTFSNLKNGLKKAEAQGLIPRGMQELVRKEISCLLEAKENIMIEFNEHGNIIIKAKYFMEYLEKNNGFDRDDFVKFLFNGNEREAATFLDIERRWKKRWPGFPTVFVDGDVIFPAKSFTREVRLNNFVFSNVPFGDAILEIYSSTDVHTAGKNGDFIHMKYIYTGGHLDLDGDRDGNYTPLIRGVYATAFGTEVPVNSRHFKEVEMACFPGSCGMFDGGDIWEKYVYSKSS